MMIDFHCHILQGIDDGSHDTEESLALIQEENKQGIQTIILTPHFYAHRDRVDHFLTKREERYLALQSAMKEHHMETTTFYLGAEVYYFGGIGKAEMVEKLCIQGTDLLLLEMPFCQWTREMLDDIRGLIRTQKVTVILAHIERYFSFQKDKGIMNQILDLPVILQMNAGSFLAGSKFMDFEGKKKRRKCLELLDEPDYHILLGSDAHNMHARKPNLAAGRAVIAEKIGTDRLLEIDSLGERILCRD